jgi:hypothetical protein
VPGICCTAPPSVRLSPAVHGEVVQSLTVVRRLTAGNGLGDVGETAFQSGLLSLTAPLLSSDVVVPPLSWY